MGLNKLFADFGCLLTSCCSSLGHIAGYASSFLTAISSKQIAKSSEMNL